MSERGGEGEVSLRLITPNPKIRKTISDREKTRGEIFRRGTSVPGSDEERQHLRHHEDQQHRTHRHRQHTAVNGDERACSGDSDMSDISNDVSTNVHTHTHTHAFTHAETHTHAHKYTTYPILENWWQHGLTQLHGTTANTMRK